MECYLSFYRIFLFCVLPMCSLAATLEEDLAVLIRGPRATLGSSTSITVYTNPSTTVEFLKAVLWNTNLLIYEQVSYNLSNVSNISNAEVRTTLNLASDTSRKDGIYKVKVATGAATNITVIISNGNALLESTKFPYVVLSERNELSLHVRHVNEQFLESQLRWRHNGKSLGRTRASFTFTERNSSVDDEGIYECFESGHYRRFEHAVMSVIVRECPENRWGPTSCQNECPACQNGGVCSDETGSCLCPPGFSGQQCERAHGKSVFGQNGQYKCDETRDDDDDGCRGFVICYIRPFGCSCPAGYTGIYCDEDCEEGKYGANCGQTCTCVEGETCARDTGQCYATDEDHTFTADLLSYRKREALTFSRVSSSSINVSWPEWQEGIDVGNGPVTGYLLFYRSDAESFTTANVGLSLSHVIDGLEADTEYEFKVAVVGPENLVGPLSDLQIQKTLCAALNQVQYVSSVKRGGDLYIYWQVLNTTTNDCPVIGYQLTYTVNRYLSCPEPANEESVDIFVATTPYILTNLNPFTLYKVRVAAKGATSEYNGPFSDPPSYGLTEKRAPSYAPVVSVDDASNSSRQLVFTWELIPCKFLNGIFRRYTITSNGTTGEQSVANQNVLSRTITGLHPCTYYDFNIRVVNDIGDGPTGEVVASTGIERPGNNFNLRLQAESDTCILGEWERPHTHPCAITRQYITIAMVDRDNCSQNLDDAETFQLGSSVRSRRFRGLVPNSLYRITIWATNSVGAGAALSKELRTRQIVPGLPVNLIVSRRALYDLTIEWEVPFKQRGTIVKYELQYKAIAKPYCKVLRDEHAITFTINNPKESNSYKIANLEPSTIYEILVSAYNREGQGKSASINGTTVLFKDLQAVNVNHVSTSRKETSAQVILPALTQLYATGYNIRIKTLQKRGKRMILTLGGYEENQDDYITAALDKEDNERSFTIGDGKAYGGYFNAPLKKAKQYEMYVHTLSRVGEEVEAVSSEPIPLHGEVSRFPIIVFLILLIVASILVTVFCMIALHKRKTTRTGKENRNPDYEIPSNVRQQEETETQHEKVIHTYESRCANAENDADLTSSLAACYEYIKLKTSTEPYYDRVIKNSRPICIKVTDFQNFMAMDENDLSDLIMEEFVMLQRLQRDTKTADVPPAVEAHPSGVTHAGTELVAVSNILDANYIKDCEGKRGFIATQGPQSKFKAVDFWRMIWQEDVKTIVMLQDTPSGSSDTFSRYWPEHLNTSEIFYEITVLWEELLSFDKYTLRKMTIIKNNEKVCRTVQQVQIHGWANREVPGDTTDLISIVQKVKILQDDYADPVLVHCGDGCGATGTFIAVYCLMDVIKKSKTICISDFVKTMREDRPGMVQTERQYLFVYQTLREAQLIPDGSSIFLDQLKASDDCSLKQKARKEYEMLQKMEHIFKAQDGIDGKAIVNIHKNRFQNIIPGDYFRPILTSKGYWSNSNDYINATILENYDSRQIVITQSPMKNTLEDFWRLVYDYECSTIIMIDDLDSTDKTFAQYWPDVGKITYGSMTIARRDEAVETTSNMRQFLLCHEMTQNSLSVQQFVCNIKPKEGQKYDVSKLAEFVAYTRNKLSNKCLIHCRNGVGLCVVYAIVMSQIKRLNLEGVCDVFLSAHNSIKRNQHVFQSQEEYTLCLQLLRSYYVNEAGYAEVL